VLFWTGIVLLGAFGMYFSFANYPWFGTAAVLLILLLVVNSERKRRATQNAREAVRRQHRQRP